MYNEILLAGFGGQGILFAGKVLAQTGMMVGKNVSWLPSYGPEMRGGTANCNVIIADGEVGSPIVNNPDILVCLNKPSAQKFVPETKSGGVILLDSSLIDEETPRKDVKIIKIPATTLHPLANMVMLGKLIKETGIFNEQQLIEGLKSAIPARKADLLEKNLEAIDLGINY